LAVLAALFCGHRQSLDSERHYQRMELLLLLKQQQDSLELHALRIGSLKRTQYDPVTLAQHASARRCE